MAGGPTVTLTFAGDADRLNKAFDSVGASASAMSGKVDSAGSSVGSASRHLNGVGEAADGAEGKFRGFADIAGGSMDAMRALSDESLSTGDRLQLFGQAGADLAGGVAQFLIPALSAGVTGIKAMSLALLTSPITWIVVGIGLIVAAFIWLWNNVEGFRNFWKAAWEGIKSFAGAAIDWISGAFQWFASLPGKISGWFGAAKDGAISMLGNLVSWVTGLPGRILSALGSLGSLLLSAGGDLLRGLWNGISNTVGWLKNKIMSWAGSLLPGWVKSILGIHSPSKVFADLGKHIPSGLAVGIEGNLAPIEDASVSMKNAAMGDYMAGAGAVSRGSSSGATITFAGGTDSAFATAFQKLVRTGQIRIA